MTQEDKPQVSSTTSITGSVNKTEDSLEDLLENKLQEKLPRFTEILGVFVALFTFVSIQVQIFSRVTSLANAVLFSFLIFLCMIGFLFTLHLVINMKGESLKDSKWALIGLVFIVGVGLFSISYLLNNDIPLSVQEDIRITNMEKEIENIKGRIIRP